MEQKAIREIMGVTAMTMSTTTMMMMKWVVTLTTEAAMMSETYKMKEKQT